MTTEQRVLEALKASTALMAITKGVSSSRPTKESQLPWVSYYKLQAQRHHEFNATGYDTKTIVVDIWSKSTATNNQMETLATTALSFLLKDIEVDITEPNLKHKNIKYFINE